MADTHETVADITAEMRRNFADGNPYYAAGLPDRLEAAHRRETTILIDALAEVVASIEVRFPVIEYALDRKPYLDAKKILEQYKEKTPCL